MSGEQISYQDLISARYTHQINMHRILHDQIRLRADRESPDETIYYEEQEGTRIIVYRYKWFS